LVALHISAMSEAGQYGERGGLLQHEHPAQMTSDTSSSGSAEAQLNIRPSGSSSITTEHDFRFPRRPADQQQQRQQPQGTSSSSQSRHVFPGTSRVPKDKLDFSGLDSVSKELLRESFFPTWKDDASGAELDSPDEMQKKDPLATQIWRLYSKTKKQLPNQERMENLTWRMMAMNLRKRKQEDAARYVPNVMCFETWNDI
jgi:GATA-binding protein, other eukaryote